MSCFGSVPLWFCFFEERLEHSQSHRRKEKRHAKLRREKIVRREVVEKARGQVAESVEKILKKQKDKMVNGEDRARDDDDDLARSRG